MSGSSQNSWHNRCGWCDQRCSSGSALAVHEAECPSRIKEAETKAAIAAAAIEKANAAT